MLRQHMAGDMPGVGVRDRLVLLAIEEFAPSDGSMLPQHNSMEETNSIAPREVLFIAHPGHELRVHHWLETVRPLIYILTDGSGGSAEARLDETKRIMDHHGVESGGLFGRFEDQAIYDMIRDGQTEKVIDLAEELTEEWDRLGITRVTGDMLEGSNTAHDLSRYLISAVIERLRRKRSRTIENWDFPLENAPDRFAHSAMDDHRIVALDDAAFQRKIATAQQYDRIKAEVARAVSTYGLEAFKSEVFRRAPLPCGLEWTDAGPPLYEVYGGMMVAQGRYKEVITYRRHMQPLAQALWQWALG